MDRRIRKTRGQLLTAMVGCLEKTDWEDLSIRQICDAADIARSTFYLHFQNKSELLDYAFGFLAEEMRDAPRSRSLDADGTFGSLPIIFEMMTQRNHGFLFRRNNGSTSANMANRRLASVLRELLEEEARQSKFSGTLTGPKIEFIAAGIFAAIEHWHLQELPERTNSVVIRELDELISKLL